MMLNTELYWLAGLLEGEGSFMTGSPSRPNKPVISVEMTDRDTIEKVSNLFKTKCVVNKQRKDFKPTFSSRLTGARAVSLMQELYPLMSIRRKQQIDRAISSFTQLRTNVSEEQVRRMKWLSSRGFLHKEIAQELKLARETVTRHLNK